MDNWVSKGLLTVPYASYQSAFLDMMNGRTDGVFADTAVAADWLKQHKEYAVVGTPVTDAKYFGTGFGIAVAKGNQELLTQLNKGLERSRPTAPIRRSMTSTSRSKPC